MNSLIKKFLSYLERLYLGKEERFSMCSMLRSLFLGVMPHHWITGLLTIEDETISS
jgi:hypothetical protein